MIKNQKSRDGVEKSPSAVKYILVLANIILILISIVFSWAYSQNLRKEQKAVKLDAFCATIESMKQVSDNYLRMELGYAKDWAQYIERNDMTIEEALNYINASNHQEDRYAHIVDMQTFQAYTTYSQDGSDLVSCYQNFYDRRTEETYQLFLDTMQKMLASESDFNILGKYRADDT